MDQALWSTGVECRRHAHACPGTFAPQAGQPSTLCTTASPCKSLLYSTVSASGPTSGRIGGSAAKVGSVQEFQEALVLGHSSAGMSTAGRYVGAYRIPATDEVKQVLNQVKDGKYYDQVHQHLPIMCPTPFLLTLSCPPAQPQHGCVGACSPPHPTPSHPPLPPWHWPYLSSFVARCGFPKSLFRVTSSRMKL